MSESQYKGLLEIYKEGGDRYRELSDKYLSTLGALRCIGMWLTGDLEEATPQQLYEMICKEMGVEEIQKKALNWQAVK